MQYLHVFVCFALVPLASSAAAECLKSKIQGQSAQGQLAIGRARDAAGRPETPYIFDSTQMPVSMPTTATALSGERARFICYLPTKTCDGLSGS